MTSSCDLVAVVADEILDVGDLDLSQECENGPQQSVTQPPPTVLSRHTSAGGVVTTIITPAHVPVSATAHATGNLVVASAQAAGRTSMQRPASAHSGLASAAAHATGNLVVAAAQPAAPTGYAATASMQATVAPAQSAERTGTQRPVSAPVKQSASYWYQQLSCVGQSDIPTARGYQQTAHAAGGQSPHTAAWRDQDTLQGSCETVVLGNEDGTECDAGRAVSAGLLSAYAASTLLTRRAQLVDPAAAAAAAAAAGTPPVADAVPAATAGTASATQDAAGALLRVSAYLQRPQSAPVTPAARTHTQQVQQHSLYPAQTAHPPRPPPRPFSASSRVSQSLNSDSNLATSPIQIQMNDPGVVVPGVSQWHRQRPSSAPFQPKITDLTGLPRYMKTDAGVLARLAESRIHKPTASFLGKCQVRRESVPPQTHGVTQHANHTHSSILAQAGQLVGTGQKQPTVSPYSVLASPYAVSQRGSPGGPCLPGDHHVRMCPGT